MRQLHHTVQARRDLLDIWIEIAMDNPTAADRVYDRLEARAATLTRFPELGQARPEIAATARVLVESPYLILYRILADTVQIVRVVHGVRHIDSALFEAGL